MVGLKAPGPGSRAPERGVGKWMLQAFLATFPKEHLAATLSNFSVLCKLLAPPVPASPGLWWELSVERSRRFGEHPPTQPGSQPLPPQQVFKARSCLEGHQSQMWIIDGISSALKNNQNPLSLSDDQLPKNPSYQNHREHLDFQAIIWTFVLKSLYGIATIF